MSDREMMLTMMRGEVRAGHDWGTGEPSPVVYTVEYLTGAIEKARVHALESNRRLADSYRKHWDEWDIRARKAEHAHWQALIRHYYPHHP